MNSAKRGFEKEARRAHVAVAKLATRVHGLARGLDTTQRDFVATRSGLDEEVVRSRSIHGDIKRLNENTDKLAVDFAAAECNASRTMSPLGQTRSWERF